MSAFEKPAPCWCEKPDCRLCGRMKVSPWVLPGLPEARSVESELNELLKEVSRASGVKVEQIVGKSREGDVCVARQMFCYAARRRKWPFAEIGKAIKRHYSTVIHANSTIEGYLSVGHMGCASIASRLGIA